MNPLAVIPPANAIVPSQQIATVAEHEYREGFVLPVFETVPRDCGVAAIHDRRLWPLVEPGEVVVFERGRFYPVPGGLRVVEYSGVGRYATPTLHAVQVWPHRGEEGRWSEGPLRPRPGSELAKRVCAFIDGPYLFDTQTDRTRGRILGIYRPHQPKGTAPCQQTAS